MPVISMFYGIVVRMFNYDNLEHHLPHIHCEYQGQNGVFDIPNGELITGELPRKQIRLVQAWIEIHREDLMADWSLAISGERVFKIKPLD